VGAAMCIFTFKSNMEMFSRLMKFLAYYDQPLLSIEPFTNYRGTVTRTRMKSLVILAQASSQKTHVAIEETPLERRGMKKMTLLWGSLRRDLKLECFELRAWKWF